MCFHTVLPDSKKYLKTTYLPSMSLELYTVILLVTLLFVALLAIKSFITNERLKYENHILRFVAAAQQAELEKLKNNESNTTENLECFSQPSEVP
jgi:cell division protein FtsB